MRELLQQNPKLRAAIEQEESIRRLPYTGLSESICGIDVAPFTLRHCTLLESVGSPFICGGVVESADVGVLFLVLSGSPSGWRRWRLLRRVGKLKFEDAINSVRSYLDDAFLDAPPESTGGDDKSYFSNCAALVDLFASEYGWTREAVLDSPMKMLHQEFRAMLRRRDKDTPMSNKLSGKEHAAVLWRMTESLRN